VTKSQAAVFVEPGRPLAIESFALPDRIEPGAALCEVRMSTICGSDLHTISGRRQEPTPIILGHEIVGQIVALGPGLERDGFGDPLCIGDRVSWSIMASCGTCYFCRLDLPQKCVALRKYGHTACTDPPHLTGGYAQHVYLFPGTAIYRVPDSLSDEIATPANCALSTVVHAVETIGVQRGETVLIQGAGLLGLNLIALCREAGAASIHVTDVSSARLELARRFGADHCWDLSEQSAGVTAERVLAHTDGYGADVAFEVCGAPTAAVEAVRALRIGGRYLVAGLVTPGSDLGLDGNQLTRKCLTLKGIHNYHPRHLGRSLEFLKQHAARYPYAELVGAAFSLDQINQAVQAAASGQFVRVAVRPGIR
jgi:putative phosphonate catabolism associated alcohol dehydrogenase